jgi:hypothetical protein
MKRGALMQSICMSPSAVSVPGNCQDKAANIVNDKSVLAYSCCYDRDIDKHREQNRLAATQTKNGGSKTSRRNANKLI